MRRLWGPLVLVGAIACGIGFALRGGDTAERQHLEEAQRARHVQMAASGSVRTPEEVASIPLLELEDPGTAMEVALEASAATEPEVVAYYETHRAVFGTRSLDQSREMIERIVRHQKAAERLRSGS